MYAYTLVWTWFQNSLLLKFGLLWMMFWTFLDAINISYLCKKEKCIYYNFNSYFENLYVILFRCWKKRFIFLSLEDSIYWLFSKFVEYMSFHAKSPRLICKNDYVSLFISHKLSPRTHSSCKYMLLLGICKKTENIINYFKFYWFWVK